MPMLRPINTIVLRVRRFEMWTCPGENSISIQVGVSSLLEGSGVIRVECQPCQMRKPVDPGLRVGLRALDWTDVMRFTIIWKRVRQKDLISHEKRTIPRNDLYNVDLIAPGDELLPAANKEPIVTPVYPLFNMFSRLDFFSR